MYEPKEIAAAIVKLIDEFSWRRFVGLMLIVLVIGGGLVVYERLTSSFQLSRLHRAAQILAVLGDLDTAATTTAIADAKARILSDLQGTLDRAPITARLPRLRMPPIDRYWIKFLANVSVWVVVGIIIVVFSTEGRGSGFIGSLFLGIMFGFVTGFVPTLWWPFFNLVAVPLIAIVLFGTAVATIASVATRRRRIRQSAEA